MKPIRVMLILAFVAASVLVTAAQVDDVISVDSSLVRLNVGVVDQKGRPIINLSRDSFSIYEDGVKQKIVRFEPTTAPFSVVMLLDMSGSTLGFRETIRQSAYRFIDALGPNDRVAVIEFYEKVNVLNDFTTNRDSVANSIRAANGRGKTQLYKAVEVALQKLSKESGRRKAIVILTDGVDTPSRDQDRKALEKMGGTLVDGFTFPPSDAYGRVSDVAIKQGVTIYPLALPTGDPDRLADPTMMQVSLYRIARRRLQGLADNTGGLLNTINRLEEMGRIYAEVAASVRTLYTIEYQPTNDRRDGKWRKITIETSEPGLVTKTKPGYFAK